MGIHPVSRSPTSRDPVPEACMSRTTSCLSGRNPQRPFLIKQLEDPRGEVSAVGVGGSARGFGGGSDRSERDFAGGPH